MARCAGRQTITRYRDSLPQLDGRLFLTDGGLETTLIFHEGLELPGLVLESATWRANADWGARLGYTAETLADASRSSIALLEPIRDDRAARHARP